MSENFNLETKHWDQGEIFLTHKLGNVPTAKSQFGGKSDGKLSMFILQFQCFLCLNLSYKFI